ncbi:hypothetical protein GSI_07908 [Ganoderma sinense ZZ0214-1]|uniref:EF-hand domain-containing protein n=1 Tax=Ganoderma sinense ZZ0214-1 TaxID=1077348 RepID=A0A2G8S8D5_9APHY|nr:hypothetical protein GSI_07908 [Ganoderma sinense ZZ0214-1]
MSLHLSPKASFTNSPELQIACLSSSPSSSSTSSSSLAFDEETLTEEKRPVRFRSASLAVDAATASFGRYKGWGRNGRGKNGRAQTDRVLAINTEMGYIGTMMSPLASAAGSGTMSFLQSGQNTIVEGLPELLKVLQDVAAIHPFIALAVGAFKVAIELDLKRRENDKKIGLLFLEMKDMMSGLVELQNVQDGPNHIGKDGQTIQERLQGHVRSMEQDIRECANVCDTYAKTGILHKVLRGSRWDDVLQIYVRRFSKRRADIEFALAVHLGVNIDIAHRKLDALGSKVDAIIDLLCQSTTPDQRELAAFVQRRGGPDAVLEDETLLASLYRERSATVSTSGSTSSATSRDRVKLRRRESTVDFQALKAELLNDPDIAIANNLESFERKFMMQQTELAAEMRRIIHHQGDLIISAVTAGPHDRIIDPDLRNIWKEMRWRGNVKARHFVLALRDYCLEKLDKLRKNERTFIDCGYPTRVTEQDEWTLEYINVTRLQAIIEAFDDDASGFITVGEANAFTTARPADWSLLHWMAYWAVGWQMAMTHYVVQIDQLLNKMFSVKSLVLPANRRFIERYLDAIWSPITELTLGFRRAEWSEVMREKFERYVVEEEDRMREKLETIRYDIDGADMLTLVTGPGRIEKNVFVLLYLLLKRDFEIMRLARTTVLHKDELWDSANTLEWVFRAVSDRHHDLENLFKQQNHEPAQQFKSFAFEMFNYWHDPSPLWSFDRLRESRYVDHVYSDADEMPNVSPSEVLNHHTDIVEDPLVNPDFIESEEDRMAQGPLHAILGHWCGYIGKGDVYPSHPMISFDLHAAGFKENQFVASGISHTGTRWKLVGVVEQDADGRSSYTFTVSYSARFGPRRFCGALTDNGRVFSGTWSPISHNNDGIFYLKRLSCDTMRFWPSLDDLDLNKPRSLWRFAIRAVLDQVRRRLLAKSRLRERLATRRHYVQLIRTNLDGLALSLAGSGEELEKTKQCLLAMTPSEARFYRMVYEYRLRLAPKHFGINCAHCRAGVTGPRVICLDCHTSRDALDLCDKADCLGAVIGLDRKADLHSPHLPSHRLLKVRKVVHRHREFGSTYRAAHDALLRAEEALSDATLVHDSHDLHEPAESCHPETRAERIMRRELLCIGCQARVSRPCWYCIECEDNTFLCPACESSQTPIKGRHKPMHALVLCQPPRAANQVETNQSEWLGALEAKFDEMQKGSTLRLEALENKIDGLAGHVGGSAADRSEERRLEDRLNALDGKMQKIEDMLGVLLSKLG